MYHVLILHFDDTYFYQNSLREKSLIEIDLRGYRGTCFMSSVESLRFIEKRIPKIHSLISFIGKGDYHYISYIFLKRINEPFTLFVVDNHLDMKYSDKNFIRCDSWLYNAGLLKNLKQIFYVNSSNIDRTCKVKLPIYLSIDKDIIDEKYLKTRWTQGNISPMQLFEFVSRLLADNRIIGIDVCGEPELDIEEIRKSEEINLSIVELLQSVIIKKSA